MPTHDASASDEVSLVDLAVLLVKRWKLLLTIFTLIALATLAFALLRPTSYTYTSLYAIAETLDEEGELSGLETPGAVKAKLTLSTLPAQISAYLDEKGWQSLPFNVDAQRLGDTRLIALTTEADSTQAGNVEALHRRVIEALVEDQEALYRRKRESLERRLSSIRQIMSSAGAAKEGLVESAGKIESELGALQAGRIEQIAVRSLRPQGIGTGLIVALGLVLALLLAVVGAFVAHFTTLIRESLAFDVSHKRGDRQITKANVAKGSLRAHSEIA